MLFNIGKFPISVIGNNQLVDLLPSNWKRYAKYDSVSKKRILLELEDNMLQYEKAFSDGWYVKQINGNTYARYILQGNVAFELRYNFFIRKDEVTVCVRKALNSYVCMGVQYGLMLVLYQTCLGLHGVTLLCSDEIVILSAPSGTGKTTLSKLLEKYCDALVINGDFALLSVSDEGVIFEPTPFCGSSNRYLNHRVRVDRIVFLDQAEINHWQLLTGREALIRILNNSFIPSWDSEVESIIQNNLMKSISYLKINEFSFAPTKEAAEVFLTNIN